MRNGSKRYAVAPKRAEASPRPKMTEEPRLRREAAALLVLIALASLQAKPRTHGRTHGQTPSVWW